MSSLAERPRSLFAGVEPLEVFVELLAEISSDEQGGGFYDRICEAICRLTTMRRAAIFIADSQRGRVRAVGAHGTPFSQLASLRPTLLETPIAQRALLDDAVVVVSERIEEAVPAAYADLLGITTLVCTPLSAAGRAYGVICADRGGGRFELSDGERHLLWTLGKTAALVATAGNVGRAMTVLAAGSPQLETALSAREQQVLELIAAGATNREIAASLFLSPHTIKEHTSALYRKLGARNRADAVLRAQRFGLVA